jgi:hypothetical protein
MKSTAFLYTFMIICLAAVGVEPGRPDAKPDDKEECAFSITGMWKSEVLPGTDPIFIHFLPNGWVRLVGYSNETLPQDFEIIAEVKYKLDTPAAPKSIEFTTERGNDVFPPGVTSMEITEYSDNSFTTVAPESGQPTQWVRAETRRYFLTFAARNGPAQRGGYAFAIWAALDGRGVEVEALGVQTVKDAAGKMALVFGPIPAEVYNGIADEANDKRNDERNKDKNVIMRLELTEAEFARTQNVYRMWDNNTKNRALPYSDPYLNALELLRGTAESLNHCREMVKIQGLTPAERERIISQQKLPQYLVEFIGEMRKRNEGLHVADAAIPWNWRPIL